MMQLQHLYGAALQQFLIQVFSILYLRRWTLQKKNTAVNELSKKSAAFNFTKEDEVNDAEFNEVLWKGIKGMNSIVPSPKRAAFVKVNTKKDGDD